MKTKKKETVMLDYTNPSVLLIASDILKSYQEKEAVYDRENQLVIVKS